MTPNIPSYFIDELQVKLLNTGFSKLGQDWNYSNIVSPFTRLYYILEGEGYILPNNKMHQLKPGYLYIIPSFMLCSYHCTNLLSQHYIHFTNQFPSGINIYDFVSVQNEVKALPIDIYLFERLIELNKVAASELDNAAVRRELADVCRQMQRPKHAEMWAAAALACEQRQAGKQPLPAESPR